MSWDISNFQFNPGFEIQTIQFPIIKYQCYVEGEDIDIFDSDKLKRTAFKDVRQASDTLQRIARLNGFNLSISQRTKDIYLRLHCSKGAKSTSKSKEHNSCPVYYRIINCGNFARIGKCEVRHNHQIIPQMYAEYNLPNEAISMINVLHQTNNFTNYQISQIIEALYNITLNPRQIHHVTEIPKSDNNTLETNDLYAYMKENGGICEIYSENREKVFRTAVLTMMPEERNNLFKYCDVIGIDGTYAPLKSNWTIVPITLLDEGRHIQSGGIIFCASFSIEIIFWFLSTIINILGERSRNIKVLITDQDNSFEAPIRKILQDRKLDFGHVICALHKSRNFYNKVNKCEFTKDEKSQLEYLFKIIAYSRSKRNVKAANDAILRDYSTKSEKFKKYYENHIVNDIPHFSKAYISDKFTCGLNTSSFCESFNNMIKRSYGKTPKTLKEARIHFNQVLYRHDGLIQYDIYHTDKHNPTFIEELANVRLSKRVRNILQHEIDESAFFFVKEGGENEIIVSHREHERITYCIHKNSMEYVCECQFVQNQGIPCTHLITLVKQNIDIGPLQIYFNPRWNLQTNQEISNLNDNCVNQRDIDLLQDSCVFEEDITNNQIDYQEDSTQSNLCITLDELRLMSNEARYRLLINESKPLANAAKLNPETTLEICSHLRDIKRDICQCSSNPEKEIEDEAGVRVGKHKKSKAQRRVRECDIHRTEMKKQRRWCRICHKDHDHFEDDCPLFERCPELKEIRNANFQQEAAYYSGRCPICAGIGHRRKRCPYIWVLDQYFDDEEGDSIITLTPSSE